MAKILSVLLKNFYLNILKIIFIIMDNIKLMISILAIGAYIVNFLDLYLKSPIRFPNHKNLSLKKYKIKPEISKREPIIINVFAKYKINLK